jgi:hypothetical protein
MLALSTYYRSKPRSDFFSSLATTHRLLNDDDASASLGEVANGRFDPSSFKLPAIVFVISFVQMFPNRPCDRRPCIFNCGARALMP